MNMEIAEENLKFAHLRIGRRIRRIQRKKKEFTEGNVERQKKKILSMLIFLLF